MRQPQDEQRRTAEASLRRLVAVIATCSDLLWESDADMRVVQTYIPTGAADTCDYNGLFLGRSLAETAGRLYASDALFTEYLENLRARRPFRDFVFSVRYGGEGAIWLESSGTPVFGENGEFHGYQGTTRDITARREKEFKSAFLAAHDSLTSLPNRRTFQEQLLHIVKAASPGSAAVLYLDLDGFKFVNDTNGHATGDGLLREVAIRLKACAPERAMVARLSGDEFAIVLEHLNGEGNEPAVLAQRVLEAISQPCEIEGERLHVTVTIGIAFVSGRESADQLLKNADIALCTAKRIQRGTFVCFDASMGERFEARRLLEIELRAALNNGEFELHYQPYHDAQTRRMTGLEAVLRWRHPSRGVLLPDEFIGPGEETSLMVSIGEWMIRQSCADAVKWQADISVAVRLSAIQFRNPRLLAVVADALNSSGLAGRRLELEITEAAMTHSHESTTLALNGLRDLGVAISLADFGSGYSPLSYLRRFPFRRIKIAQKFVRELAEIPAMSAVFRAITALGSSLHLQTTAEGVETEEQLHALQTEGCAEAQGRFFGAPRPACEFPVLGVPAKSNTSSRSPEASLESLSIHMTGDRYVLDSQTV